MSEPLLKTLSDRIARPVGDSERKRARLHLLDWLACVVGARDSEAGHLGGLISRLGWERATYVGNAIGLEDVHSAASLNPAPVIWPAAMSLSSADMEARLDASVRGYEAMIAIGAAFDAHHREQWDATSTAGVFGAAAAFGSLIGFAPVEYANALGNAGSVAGGLLHMQHDDVLTKQWHIYHAVRTARDAAMHVHHGATGPMGVLEGPQGLFAAMTEQPGAIAVNNGGWLIEEVEITDTLGDPALPADEARIAAKMHALAKQGGVSAQDADRAIDLALNGDDPAAIDSMIEDWLA